MNQCFITVVENILGRTVKDQILNLLERNGIQRSEISSRFDEVVQVLTVSFGECVRVLVFKTVTELYKEYSLRADFSFGASLKDQIALLKQRVVSDLLQPSQSPSIEDSIQLATREQGTN
jgi:hypothetical protein